MSDKEPDPVWEAEVLTKNAAPCVQPGCGHPDGEHHLIATTGNPRQGGIRLCPEPGCKCYATWGVPQLGIGPGDVFVPDEIEIQSIRENIQQDQLRRNDNDG